jgi:EpsI family protein
MNLPEEIGNFDGTPQEVSDAEKVILPPDTEFAKMLYTDPDGETVNAQIVLAGAEKRSIHRPEVCLPGQGWTIKSSQTLPSGAVLPVTMLRIARPIDVNGKTAELESLFLYWFVGKDTATASHLVRVLKTNLDVLLTNTNHRWAYVIASAPVLAGLTPSGKTEPETLAMLKDFIAKFAPDIMKSEQPSEPQT